MIHPPSYTLTIADARDLLALAAEFQRNQLDVDLNAHDDAVIAAARKIALQARVDVRTGRVVGAQLERARQLASYVLNFDLQESR